MGILVVNDDGITSVGIHKLAMHARAFGDVTVVAPAAQCSAMSRRITVHGELNCTDRTAEFNVDGVKAYAVDGTPADCVKLAVYYICDERPDIVFSGINNGYNVGTDLCYSGTMGAALEALERGIPAIAYSCKMGEEFGTADAFFSEVTREILHRGTRTDAVWNVNFPGIGADACQGILWDRVPDRDCYFRDAYEVRKEAGRTVYVAGMTPTDQGMTGSDVEAVLNGYVSVGMYHSSY